MSGLTPFREFYTYEHQTNEKIDKEIQGKQSAIEWNKSFIECLSKGEVHFDKQKWSGNDIESDVADDFYMIAKSIDTLTQEEKEWLYRSYDLTFEELKKLLKKHGYTEEKDISDKLNEIYTEQNQSFEEDIQELSRQKEVNNESNKLLYMLGMIPSAENTEKVMKYERSLQKSIYQNLIMLKKLQGVF